MAGFTALTGIIFFFFFGARILALFNPLYVAYLPILLIISCAQLFSAVAGSGTVLLNMSGHQRVNLILTVSIGGLGIALQVLGGLYYGAIGVASATAGATIFTNLATAVYAWRILGVDSTGFSVTVQALRRHCQSN